MNETPTSWDDLGMDWDDPNPFERSYYQALLLALLERFSVCRPGGLVHSSGYLEYDYYIHDIYRNSDFIYDSERIGCTADVLDYIIKVIHYLIQSKAFCNPQKIVPNDRGKLWNNQIYHREFRYAEFNYRDFDNEMEIIGKFRADFNGSIIDSDGTRKILIACKSILDKLTIVNRLNGWQGEAYMSDKHEVRPWADWGPTAEIKNYPTAELQRYFDKPYGAEFHNSRLYVQNTLHIGHEYEKHHRFGDDDYWYHPLDDSSYQESHHLLYNQEPHMIGTRHIDYDLLAVATFFLNIGPSHIEKTHKNEKKDVTDYFFVPPITDAKAFEPQELNLARVTSQNLDVWIGDRTVMSPVNLPRSTGKWKDDTWIQTKYHQTLTGYYGYYLLFQDYGIPGGFQFRP